MTGTLPKKPGRPFGTFRNANTHRIGLSVSSDLHKAILTQASQENRTLAGLIRHALDIYISHANHEEDN